MTDDKPDWIFKAADAWLKLEDVNVICTSWQDGNHSLYHFAVSNSPIVARQISILLYYLAELNGTNLNDENFLNRIELVGHSLGAHISGFVGKDFAGKLSKITGLDPAGPDFAKMTRSHRLDRFDAKLVTVIHSNRGQLDYLGLAKEGLKAWTKGKKNKKSEMIAIRKANNSKGKNAARKLTNKKEINDLVDENNIDGKDSPTFFGIDQQVGDIDFYANDGAEQPGCEGQVAIRNICNHGRSTEIYHTAIKYMLDLKSKSNNPVWLKRSRPLAFKTSDFDQFSTGLTFQQQCPAILKQKQSSSEEISQTFSNCALPIDFISPADDYITELRDDFGVDFDKTKYSPNSKYIFKTLPTEPYIGDHYILKLELDKTSSNWDETCGLNGELVMADGTMVQVDVNKNSEFIDDENFYGLAMPFISPMKTDAPFELNQILTNKHEDNPSITAKSVSKVVPYEIKLKISSQEEKLTKTAQKTKDKKKKSTSNKKKSESTTTTPVPTTVSTIATEVEETQTPETTNETNPDQTPEVVLNRCRLRILKTEVEPIIADGKGLIGLYDRPKRQFRMKSAAPVKKVSWFKRIFHIRDESSVSSKQDNGVDDNNDSIKEDLFNQLIEASQTDILCSNTTPTIIRRFNRLTIKAK